MEKSFILIIITILAGLTAGDYIKSDKQDVSSIEGESVTLSCSYTATSDYIYFYWYRQHSNQGPRFLLLKGAWTVTGEEYSSEKRFKSTTSRNFTSFVIDSLSIVDKAIYYLEEFPVRPDLGSRVFSSVCLSPFAMMLLCSFLLFSALVGHSTEDVITPFNDTVHVTEGDNVTLSCNYSGSVNNLQWYRQYPRSAPEFLLLIMESTGSVPNPKPRMSPKVDKENKRVDLELSSTEVTDSAVYYCALRPTNITDD
ncbi:uncharacterized protein [Paramormyrops kingsleyae]|uniref:uncharacterized protein n=1 Tax=Paramormyrops kingsleyae TaxID=1676925 RepID=UPI003B97B114